MNIFGKTPTFPNPIRFTTITEGWLETYNVEYKKPKGLYRIMYLGDSFTAGTAPMDESVPSLVEQGLKLVNKNIEVVNTGVSSYSPLLMYLLLRHNIIQYSPDL